MEHLYAPWRDHYVKGGDACGCPFCTISTNPDKDEEHRVLYRDTICFVVMNKYPYTPGHFLIIPHTHTDAIESLPQETWLHMSSLARIGVIALKNEFCAHGVNIGMNLGEAGGAGIAEHVHMHVLPRWPRDTNFITTIGDARIFSVDFDEIYERVKKAFLAQLSLHQDR